MQRGDIWWAELTAPGGSEPGYRRPILIVQSDAFNRSRIQTVIAVILTTNLRLAEAPGNVLLKAGQTGLPKDSVVNVSQIVTVDKAFLAERVKSISASIMTQVEDGLRIVLDM